MWIIENLGIIDYQKALEYQEYLVKLKQSGEKNNYLLFLEHFPVITRGKSAKPENILNKNMTVYSTGRGGDYTFHEPGQLVVYIILDLKKEKLKIKDYVFKLEDLVINSMKKFNIEAYKKPGIVGVWAKNKKIASIGIAVKKGVTMHGVSLNVNNNLDGFKNINPCGLKTEEISSLEKLTGNIITVASAREAVVNEFNSSLNK